MTIYISLTMTINHDSTNALVPKLPLHSKDTNDFVIIISYSYYQCYGCLNRTIHTLYTIFISKQCVY